VIDIYGAENYKCPDGSKCRILSTMGSYILYVLGIFMACVYLLGPKTSYGQSEQNPVFWLQLFVGAKKTGAKCTWLDPIANETKERILTSHYDIRLWIRFIMSFLINGVCFHVLVYALPIQVAYQTTFTSVVLRAVGMMYLVDLDDSTGFVLTLVESTESNEPVVVSEDDKQDLPNNNIIINNNNNNNNNDDMKHEEQVTVNNSTFFQDEVNRIVEEAKAKLDALASQQQPSELANTTTATTSSDFILAQYSKREAFGQGLGASAMFLVSQRHKTSSKEYGTFT
jgi:hypothetical protein